MLSDLGEKIDDLDAACQLAQNLIDEHKYSQSKAPEFEIFNVKFSISICN